MLTEDLSLIIPWCNRDTLGKTLSANLPALEASRCTVILVNCGGDSKVLASQVPRALKRGLLVEVRRSFNKCLSINIGLAMARTTLVSVVDADIIFSLKYLVEVASALDSKGFYSTAARVKESEASVLNGIDNRVKGLRRQNYLNLQFRDGKKIRLRTYNAELLTGTRAGPGLLSVHRKDLVAVGGFNSGLSYWGWEDYDIQLRLMYVLGLERKEVGTVLHLTHPDSTRKLGSLTREQANRSNMSKCLEAYDRGNFRGTYISDIQSNYKIQSFGYVR